VMKGSRRMRNACNNLEAAVEAAAAAVEAARVNWESRPNFDVENLLRGRININMVIQYGYKYNAPLLASITLSC
jgi:hypothetical protein